VLKKARLDFVTVGGNHYVIDNFDFESRSPIYGDVDNNGTVDLADAVLSLGVSIDSAEALPVFSGADVNADGRIGEEEAVFVLEMVSGLR
jgi:hypothetical protein